METENIVLEHLRAIRSQLDRVEDKVTALSEQDVNKSLRLLALDGDITSHNRRLATVEADVERIKRRLELTD